MTLTVRSASVTGAITAARALTHAEMDANWAHVIESSNQNFTHSGTGAVEESVQSRQRWTVLVTDFLSVADRASVRAGSTVAIDTALEAAADYLAGIGGGTIRIPAGNYSLNNYRPQKEIDIVGDGYEATIINQGAAGNPAYYCLSDSDTGQLIGCGFRNLKVVGHASATVAAVKIEASTPFIVHKSNIDVKCASTYSALEMVCTSANEIYDNDIKVYSATTSAIAATTEGTYNRIDLFLTGCGTGLALLDTSANTEIRCISDGQQTYNGQNNVLRKPTVETIAGTSSADYAIRISGNNNIAISPTMTDIDGADVSQNASMRIDGYNVIIQPRWQGTDFPNFPIIFGSGSTAVLIGGNDGGCTFDLNQYVTEANLNLLTFIGDCSSYLGGNFTKLPRAKYSTIPIGGVAYSSLGTSTTPVAGTIYLAELWLDAHKTLTGVGVLNGGTVGTNKTNVALFNSTGTLLRNSALAGATTSGANAFQEIAFTSTYLAPPGRYWIGVQLNGTTDRIRTIAADTYIDVKTKSSAGTFGNTPPTQTVPTTFTADVGPIAYVY